MTMGIVRVTSSSRQSANGSGGDDDIDFDAHELGGKIGEPLFFALSVAVLRE